MKAGTLVYPGRFGKQTTVSGKTVGIYATGAQALLGNTSGWNNTSVGYLAGYTATIANANTIGSFNTFIGSNAGPGVPSVASLQNATAIGANAVVKVSNALVLGSINGVNGATAAVNVGIGIAAPGFPLDVVGTIHTNTCVMAGKAVLRVCASDMRLKEKIEPFPDVLDKLVQLKPVSFHWRNELPEYRFGSGQTVGLIAQDVEQVFPEMVSTDEHGYKQVNYGQLI